MLDPVTAFGVAASAVQFLDFGIRILSKSKEIYTSQAGNLPEDAQVHQAAKTLLLHKEHLTKALGLDIATWKEASGRQGSLIELCTKCFEVADELETRLTSRNVLEGEKRRRWKSVRQALKSEWEQKELVKMRDKLAAYKSDLLLYIIVSIQENMAMCDLKRSEENGRLDQRVTQVLNTLEDYHAHKQELEFRAEDLSKAQFATQEWIATEYSKLIQEIEKRETNAQERMRWNRTLEGLLSCLRFTEMEDRYEGISDAQLNTFSWIFKDPENSQHSWSSLSNWLRGTEESRNIYWVNGKAGSGKSTLMRYIFEHSETAECLSSWAEKRHLVTAGFFFWNSGVKQQKTQGGLLRTLLYQIFSKYPKLLPKAIPEQWQRAYDRYLWSPQKNIHYSWSIGLMRKAFSTLVKECVGKFKIALFIDGLDEHDEDLGSLISLIRDLASSQDVKILISSRPLFEFEQAFGGVPSLRLQNLTQGDIKTYIDARLRANEQFLKFFQNKSQRRPILELVKEIIDSAVGVFLWVKLVVNSLLEGISYKDQLSVLRARLRALPKTLEGMFDHMLGRVNPVYLVQTSRLFQLIRSAQEFDEKRNRNTSGRLYVLFLSLAQEDDLETIYGPPELLSKKQVLERCCQMQDWLKTRCGGLLETHVLSQKSTDRENIFALDMAQDQRHWTVSYIHRSARDYLEQPRIWNTLVQHTADTNFDPHQAWTRAWIMLLKHVRPTYSFLRTYDTSLLQVLLDAQERAMMPPLHWSLKRSSEEQILVSSTDHEELLKKMAYWIMDSRISSVDLRDLEKIMKLMGSSKRGVSGKGSHLLQAMKMRQQFSQSIPTQSEETPRSNPNEYEKLWLDSESSLTSRAKLISRLFQKLKLVNSTPHGLPTPCTYKCYFVLEDNDICPAVFYLREEAEVHFKRHLWQQPNSIFIKDEFDKSDVVVEVEEFPEGFFVGGLEV